LLDRPAVAQRRQPSSLLPRIKAEASQARDHAQRNSIDLVSDRRKRKYIAVRRNERKDPRNVIAEALERGQQHSSSFAPIKGRSAVSVCLRPKP
jgi:hypothetical protein